MQPSFVSNLKARASAGGRATGSGGGPPKFNEWIAAEASSYERAEELLAAAADALLADSKAHSMLVLPTMTPAAAPEDVAGPADAAAAVPEGARAALLHRPRGLPPACRAAASHVHRRL